MTRKQRTAPDGPTLALGYVRVSTADQEQNGHGADAQETQLREEAARRGWDLEIVREEGLSAKDMNRPALVAALARLDAGQAQVLLSTKLDRVSRSVLDFVSLMDRANRQGWSVLLLEMPDTASANGELFAVIRAGFAQYERRLISQRTKEGLAAARAKGVRLGRPQSLSTDVVRRVVEERAAGKSLRTIAAELTSDGVPTARGGATWGVSSVQAVLASQVAAELSA